jgi:hypothetical protein
MQRDPRDNRLAQLETGVLLIIAILAAVLFGLMGLLAYIAI